MVLVAAKAAAVLKIVSQHVVNLRLLVRAAQTCTRTSASVQTLSRRAATVAVHQSHAVLQLAVETTTVVEMVAAMAAKQTQLAVPQLAAVTEMVAATAATQKQAAVLQLVAATAAIQLQPAVHRPAALQRLVVTVVAMVAEATLAAKAVTAATTIAATSRS